MAASISFNRKLIYLAATLCSSTAFAVVLSELLLWQFWPATKACHIPYQQSLPGVSRSIVYERNEWGMRSLSMHSLAKPPTTIRILCLGASTTDQPIQSTPDLWSAQLEKSLRDRFASDGFGMEVAAFGRGGERIGRRLEWARQHLHEFDPDIVILLEGINDLCWGEADGDVRPNRIQQTDLPSSWTELKREVLRHSQIARHLVAVRKNYGFDDLLSGNRVLEWHSERLPDIRRHHANRPMLDCIEWSVDPAVGFRQSLGSLIRVVHEQGASCIVLGQPTLWKSVMNPAEQEVLWFPIRVDNEEIRAAPAWLAKEMTRFNAIQQSVAQNAKAIYIPLDARIDKTLDNFFDDCHFTDRGNKRVATAILEDVCERVTLAIAEQRRGQSRLTQSKPAAVR